VLDHFPGGVLVVGMLVTTPENAVDDEPAPGHLEGCEALNLLLDRLAPLTFGSVVIVHDHGVEAENDDQGVVILSRQRKSRRGSRRNRKILD
jgi:hypothetical protein